MSRPAASRRETLRRAALGAGAIAAAGTLGPALARAQAPDDEDLRDFLVEAIGLEQITVLAYATAADAATGAQLKLLESFRDQEQAHANALTTALESLGFEAPDEPSDAADTEVFTGVPFEDEADLDEIAERLSEHLEGLEGLRGKQLLEYVEKLERAQLTLYAQTGATVDSEDLAATAAEIAGCQAQHLVVLTDDRGGDLAAALAQVERAALAAAPAADTATDPEDSESQ